jgi:hypothetical protein
MITPREFVDRWAQSALREQQGRKATLVDILRARDGEEELLRRLLALNLTRAQK